MNEYNTEGRYLLIVCEKVFKIVYIKNWNNRRDEGEIEKEKDKQIDRVRKKEKEKGRENRAAKMKVKVPVLFIYRKRKKCYEKLVNKDKIRRKKKKFGNIINELIIDNIIGSIEIKNEFFLFVVEKWRLLNKFFYLNKYRNIYKIEKVYFVPYNVNIMTMNTVVNNALSVDDSSNNFFINTFENTENIQKHFDIFDGSNSNNIKNILPPTENDDNFSRTADLFIDNNISTSRNVQTDLPSKLTNNTFEPFDGIVKTQKVSFSNNKEFSDFSKHNEKETERGKKKETSRYMEVAENRIMGVKGKNCRNLESYNTGSSRSNSINNLKMIHSNTKKDDRDKDKNKKLLTFNNAKKWLTNQFNHKNILNILTDITSYENKGTPTENEKGPRELKFESGSFKYDADYNQTEKRNEEIHEMDLSQNNMENGNQNLLQRSFINRNDEISLCNNKTCGDNDIDDLKKVRKESEQNIVTVIPQKLLKDEEMKNNNENSMVSDNSTSVYQNWFNRLSEGDIYSLYGKSETGKSPNETIDVGEKGKKTNFPNKKSKYGSNDNTKNDDKKIDSKMDLHKILRSIQKLLTVHMYYSYDFDLTQSIQKKRQKKIQEIEVEPMSTSSNKNNSAFILSEKKFVWNFEMIKKLKNNKKIDNNWFCSIIQGYIAYTSIEIEKKRLELFLISRRSTVMGGTRFNKRGINDDGYVANFIETEQIIRINTHSSHGKAPSRFSFESDKWKKSHCTVETNAEEIKKKESNSKIRNTLNSGSEHKNSSKNNDENDDDDTFDLENRIIAIVQIRGSVPLFWEQHSMSSHVNIQRSTLLSIKAFKEHNKKLIKNYGNNIFYVNLLSEGKSNEKKLTKKVIELMTYIKRDKYFKEKEYIHYIQYDFHTAVKNRGFEDAMNYFINKVLMKHMKKISFYMENFSFGNDRGRKFSCNNIINNSTNNNINSSICEMDRERNVKYQEGIFRTNCLDCLDRTNVFQYYYCWFLVMHILNISKNDVFLEPSQKSKLCFHRNLNNMFNKDKVIILTTLPIDNYWIDLSDPYIVDRKEQLNTKHSTEINMKNFNSYSKPVLRINREFNEQEGIKNDEIIKNRYVEELGCINRNDEKSERNETVDTTICKKGDTDVTAYSYSGNSRDNNDNNSSNNPNNNRNNSNSNNHNKQQDDRGREPPEENLHVFKQLFKKMWVENGDVISTHYTGTGSVFSSQINFGKSSLSTNIDHAIKSIERFYQNNFEDNFRQECIDIILCNGKYKQQKVSKAENVEYFMNLKKKESTKNKIKLTRQTRDDYSGDYSDDYSGDYSGHKEIKKNKLLKKKKKNKKKRYTIHMTRQVEIGEKEEKGNAKKNSQENNDKVNMLQNSNVAYDTDESGTDDYETDTTDSIIDYEKEEECVDKDKEEKTKRKEISDNVVNKNNRMDKEIKVEEKEKERIQNNKTNEEEPVEMNMLKKKKKKKKKNRKTSYDSPHKEEFRMRESSVCTTSSSSSSSSSASASASASSSVSFFSSSTVKSKENVTEEMTSNSNGLRNVNVDSNGINEYRPKQKRGIEEIYDERIIKLWIGSWNLCGNDLYELNDISSWLNSVNELVDIYVFCFQEVVELTGFRVLMNMKDKYKEKKIEQKIVQSLAELSQRQKELFQKNNDHFVKKEQQKRKFFKNFKKKRENDEPEKDRHNCHMPFNVNQSYYPNEKTENEHKSSRRDRLQKGLSVSFDLDTTPTGNRDSKSEESSVSMVTHMDVEPAYNLQKKKKDLSQEKEQINVMQNDIDVHECKRQSTLEDIQKGMTFENSYKEKELDEKYNNKKEIHGKVYAEDVDDTLYNFIDKCNKEDSNKINHSNFLMVNKSDKWKQSDENNGSVDSTATFFKIEQDMSNESSSRKKECKMEKDKDKDKEKRKTRGIFNQPNIGEDEIDTDILKNQNKIENLFEMNTNQYNAERSKIGGWNFVQEIMKDIVMKEPEGNENEKSESENLKSNSLYNKKGASTSNTDSTTEGRRYGCRHRKFKYIKLKSVSMIGLFIIIFIDEGLINDIREIEACKVKVGLKGNTGNKGSVSVKFRLGLNSFCFNNIHLASGQTNIFERNSQMQHILSNTLQNQDLNSVFTFDYFFACGDFNFRINKGHDEVIKLIEKNKTSQLLSFDQFIYTKMYNILPFCLFSEHPVSFNPTYKFKKNSNMYDTRRTPAWCDRILVSGKLIHLSELEKKKKELRKEVEYPFWGFSDESYKVDQPAINREVTDARSNEQRKHSECVRNRCLRYNKENVVDFLFIDKENTTTSNKHGESIDVRRNKVDKQRTVKKIIDNEYDDDYNKHNIAVNDFYENEKIYFNYDSYKTHNNFFSSDHKPISAVINLKVFFDKSKQDDYGLLSSFTLQSVADSTNFAVEGESNEEDTLEGMAENDNERKENNRKVYMNEQELEICNKNIKKEKTEKISDVDELKEPTTESRKNSNLFDYLLSNNVNFTSYTANSVSQFFNYANEMAGVARTKDTVEEKKEKHDSNELSFLKEDILKDGKIVKNISNEEKQKNNKKEENVNVEFNNEYKKEKTQSWSNLIDL